jgi:tight adherence protein C
VVIFLVKKNFSMVPIGALVGMLIGAFIGPQSFLDSIMKKRKAALNKELPNYLNLLSVCLKSGLDFIQSLRVINGYVTGLLPKELNLVVLGVAEGETLTEAMKGFNDRCKHEGVENFYQTIRGVERFGQLGTVADKINQLSSDIQDKMFENVKKRAASAEQKIYGPAVLILFAICIVVGGPIGMAALKNVTM